MINYLCGDALTDDEILQLGEHTTLERGDGSVYRVWRFDSSGTPWLKRVPEVSAAAREYDVYPIVPDDIDDDDDDPIEFTMIYDADGDDE